MKKIIKKLTACLVIALVVSMFSGTMVAQAATKSEFDSAVGSYVTSLGTTEADIAKKNEVIKAACNAADSSSGNSYYYGTAADWSTCGTSVVTIDNVAYIFYFGDNGNPASMTTAITKMSEAFSAESTDESLGNAKDKLKDMTDSFDISANVTEGAATLEGAKPFLEILLGIICYIAIIAMAIFTAFDVCYITMPVFQNKCNDKAMQGGAGTRNSKHGGEGGGEGRKVIVITDDAIQAVEQSAESGKSPLGLYLKKRIVSYVGIAIVLYILLSGNISLIVNLVLKAVSGVIEQLNKLA